MQKFTLELTGTAPLLMHNSRLADKLDPITKLKAAVSAKKRKTEEDDLELSRLEFLGGLYHDEDAGPYLPGDNIFKALVEAARKTKQGKQVEQGLLITTDVNALAYDGPRDTRGLWEDRANFEFRKTVKQMQARIVRVRPIFRHWSTVIEGAYDEAVLDFSDVENFAHTAGAYIGVGDWRPRYGRFEASIKKVAA